MHRFVALLVAASVFAAGCAGGSSADRSDTAQPQVRDIDNVLTLRAAFNAERGKPRILLLLSPT